MASTPVSISRRDFLTQSMVATGLSVGMAMSSLAPRVVGAAEGVRPKRKNCVFSKHLQWLDYEAMADFAADVGFDGVDLSVRPGGHVLPERVPQDLPRAVRAVRAAGLDVPMMTTAVTDPDDPVQQKTLAIAADLGIQCYRMGYLSYDNSLGIAKSLEQLKPRMVGLAKINEKYQIHGAYQNHSGQRVGGPVWDIWELIKNLNPRWIGCQYDIRHATVEGGQCWPVGLKLLLPYIRCLVAKDFHWDLANGKWRIKNVPLGQGMVDFKAFFKIIDAARIDGPFSMHFEYPIHESGQNNLSLDARKKVERAAMKRDLVCLKAFQGEIL